MKEVLAKYVGKTVGVNLEKSHHIDAVELLAVHDEYFTMRPAGDGHLHHMTYGNIVHVIEDPQGVEIRHLFTSNEKFALIIKVGHVVAYVPA